MPLNVLTSWTVSLTAKVCLKSPAHLHRRAILYWVTWGLSLVPSPQFDKSYLFALGTDKVLKTVAHYLSLDDVNKHRLNILKACIAYMSRFMIK